MKLYVIIIPNVIPKRKVKIAFRILNDPFHTESEIKYGFLSALADNV